MRVVLPLVRKLAAACDAPVAPRAGDHLLVAVSGGPDSTALLAALAELAPVRGFRVTAAHMDHGLRGAEGAAEGRDVAALAARLGIPWVGRTASVIRGTDLEARARRVRYGALAAMAREVGATRIVLGHTQDDQVETVLMNFLRGAGRRGLGGMRPTRGRLWRPLLAVTRADVRRFLADRELTFAIDRSNADLAHTRNRIRRLLVPFLETEFNPRLGPALAALAERLRDEDDLLDELAAGRLAALCVAEDLRVAVADEPPALARRIVRAWLERGRRRGVSALQIERVLALAGGRGRGAVALPGPTRALREGDLLVMRPGREPATTVFTAAIGPGEAVSGPDGAWRLVLSAPRPYAPGEGRTAHPGHALFDADALPERLVVRSPAPGDRVRLLGGGSRKLQDVLVDAKVPREGRVRVPVLAAGDRILWVAGVARAAAALVTPATGRVIEGTLHREP